MKITLGDGKQIDFPQKVSGAFAALARGDASAAQQRIVLQTIFELTKPFSVPDFRAGERAVGMMDGARVVGNNIAELVGGEAPWTLRHLGDVKDDGPDNGS